jgi:hypothetical protein
MVGASARLYDLTIVLQPESDRDTFDNTMPQEILFESGGPVLFIPHTHRGPFEPKHIGLAWDGSRVAARALRDAAPFLARATAITIISINEAQGPGWRLRGKFGSASRATGPYSADRALDGRSCGYPADDSIDRGRHRSWSDRHGGTAIRICKSAFWAELPAACCNP